MYKPFQVLDQWVREGRLSVTPAPGETQEDQLLSPWTGRLPEELPVVMPEDLPDGMPDDALFEFAMRDVHALGWSNVPLHHRPPMEIQPQNDEQEALDALEDFVRRGNVAIEQSAEYIEGSVHPHGRLYLDDLRAGRFSVQAHLDLHGLNLQEARFALDEFLLGAARKGLSCVRVIHGRGKHSHKHRPVLKENIQRWLCTRRMSRLVIAYTSARVCDGGGGAVYVLLRK